MEANKEKIKTIVFDSGGVKDDKDIFTSTEKVDELDKNYLSNSKLKTELTSTPSYTPKNFFEQFAFYDGYMWVYIIDTSGTGTWTKIEKL